MSYKGKRRRIYNPKKEQGVKVYTIEVRSSNLNMTTITQKGNDIKITIEDIDPRTLKTLTREMNNRLRNRSESYKSNKDNKKE